MTHSTHFSAPAATAVFVLGKEVPNSAKSWNELLRSTPHESPWIGEPTGRYSHEVARAARKTGFTPPLLRKIERINPLGT